MKTVQRPYLLLSSADVNEQLQHLLVAEIRNLARGSAFQCVPLAATLEGCTDLPKLKMFFAHTYYRLIKTYQNFQKTYVFA